jgi:hypothetical protein
MLPPAVQVKIAMVSFKNNQSRLGTHSRLTEGLRNAGLDILDLGRPKAGKSTLVLWTTESRADRTLKIGNWSSDRGSPLSTRLGHGYGCFSRHGYSEQGKQRRIKDLQAGGKPAQNAETDKKEQGRGRYLNQKIKNKKRGEQKYMQSLTSSDTFSSCF